MTFNLYQIFQKIGAYYLSHFNVINLQICSQRFNGRRIPFASVNVESGSVDQVGQGEVTNSGKQVDHDLNEQI